MRKGPRILRGPFIVYPVYPKDLLKTKKKKGPEAPSFLLQAGGSGEIMR